MLSTRQKLVAGLEIRKHKSSLVIVSFSGGITRIESYRPGQGSSLVDVFVEEGNGDIPLLMGYNHGSDLELAQLRNVLIGAHAEVEVRQGQYVDNYMNTYAVVLKVEPSRTVSDAFEYPELQIYRFAANNLDSTLRLRWSSKRFEHGS